MILLSCGCNFICMQVSYYSTLPRLTHLAFGMLGASAIQSPRSNNFLVLSPRLLTSGLIACL